METSNGVLSIVKMADYLFPKKGRVGPSILDIHWVRKLGNWAPIYAVCILMSLTAWPFYLWKFREYNIGALLFPLVLIIINVLKCLYPLCVLFVLSLIAKMRKREPPVLLALTLVKPLRLAFFVVIFSLIFSLVPNHYFLTIIGQYHKLEQVYRREHPNLSITPEKYWGFTIGKDSYQQVVSTLTQAQAKFTVVKQGNTGKFPVIDIQSYPPISRFGSEVTAELSFNRDNVLVEIALVDRNKKRSLEYRTKKTLSSTSKFKNLSDFFYTEYAGYMKKARVYEFPTRFITPGGLEIKMDDENVIITDISMIDEFKDDKETFEWRLKETQKIQNGRKNADLIQ